MKTQLNELTRRLALLAAPHRCTTTVRLLGGAGGTALELRAARGGASEAREYKRQVAVRLLESRGAAELAAEFIREARRALSESSPSADAAAPPAA